MITILDRLITEFYTSGVSTNLSEELKNTLELNGCEDISIRFFLRGGVDVSFCIGNSEMICDFDFSARIGTRIHVSIVVDMNNATLYMEHLETMTMQEFHSQIPYSEIGNEQVEIIKKVMNLFSVG